MEDKTFRVYGRSKPAVILIGIALTILGIAMFFHPLSATMAIASIVGWALVIVGVVTLVNAFIHRGQQGFKADVAVGLVELIPGLLIVALPGLFAAVIFELIGVVIIINGINDLVDAGIASRMGLPWVGLRVVCGALSVLFGICVLFAPFLLAEFMMVIAGVALIFDGITEIVAGVKM